MNNNFDERQCQEVNSIAKKAFYVMFVISVLSIIVQLVFLNAELMYVMGETLTLLCGGIVYLICSIKKGIFSFKGKSLTLFDNVLGSVVCSGFFSVLYGMIISRKASEDISINRYIGGFFVGISIVCFLVLFIMGKYAEHSQNINEQKYDD